MNIEYFKKKNISFLLFFFPFTFFIGIAIVDCFILIFLFSIYIGINALIQIPSNLKYSSIFHFRYVLFSMAVCLLFEKYSSKNFVKRPILLFLFAIIGLVIFDSF